MQDSSQALAPDETQWTAELRSVTSVADDGEDSFDPTDLQLVADRPYIFDVTNDDLLAAHTWGIEDGAGQQIIETGNLEANGGNERFDEALTLAAGDYAQFCGYHPSMTGTVTVT